MVKREEGTCLQRGKEKRKKKKEVHLCRMKGGKEKKRKGHTTFPNSILDVNGRDHWWWF